MTLTIQAVKNLAREPFSITQGYKSSCCAVANFTERQRRNTASNATQPGSLNKVIELRRATIGDKLPTEANIKDAQAES